MMSLIDALADTAEPMSLKALSRVTGLHPSTAHRILAAMTQSRLVDRCEAGTYGLGIRFLELGNVVKSRFDIRKIALPIMQSLHESIGEAINLAIRDGDEIVCTVSARSFLHHQVRSMVGSLKLVGEGKWTRQDLANALAAANREARMMRTRSAEDTMPKDSAGMIISVRLRRPSAGRR